MLRKILPVLFLSFLTFYSYSQEEISPGEMITDRPDETEAPNLVTKGYLQVETGIFYKEFEEENFRQELFGYNTTLLRYGLLDNLELRLGFDYVNNRITRNDSEILNVTGFEPLLVGAKIGIAEENGLLPQIGFMGHIYLPFTATEGLRPETTGVDFRFAFSNQLSAKSNLSYNLGAEWGEDSSEATYIYTIAYGYQITRSFGLYAELYGDLPENGSAAHNWDAGLTYLLRENLQLDVLVGTGFANEQNLFVGGGVSFRLPR